MDDQDVNRILSNMTRTLGQMIMIRASFNPKAKHHLMSKYLYGSYSREPVQAEVQRGEQVYVRNIGSQHEGGVSYKQYIEINKGWKDEYREEYNRLVREKKIDDKQHYD